MYSNSLNLKFNSNLHFEKGIFKKSMWERCKGNDKGCEDFERVFYKFI
jgi:hypothetical protein